MRLNIGSMIVNTTSTPILVTRLQAHLHIKNDILQSIADMPICKSKYNDGENDSINKTDWNLEEESKPYLKFCKDLIINAVSETFKKFNSNGIAFGNFWFQQYIFNDRHDYHIHKFCHWTNVYFLELPHSFFKTEIADIYGNNIIYDAHEGDIISFPSFLYHRSPIIKKPIRKTIISFNSNFI